MTNQNALTKTHIKEKIARELFHRQHICKDSVLLQLTERDPEHHTLSRKDRATN
ncbi:hypothetical protein DsansV1_C20g0164591 [Dioscorea sansibarensis]